MHKAKGQPDPTNGQNGKPGTSKCANSTAMLKAAQAVLVMMIIWEAPTVTE